MAEQSEVPASEKEVTIDQMENNKAECQNVEAPKGFFGARHTFALMSFLGLAISYMLRVNLSVAIVDMAKKSPAMDPTYSMIRSVANSSTSCSVDIVPSGDTPHQVGEFDWDLKTQGLVLGTFFYGYIAVQVPSGMLAERFGGKHVLGLGLLFTGIFNILTPFSARFSFPVLITVRVLTGIVEGVIFPSLSCLLSRWVPEPERSVLTTFINAGLFAGPLVALPLTGFLCEIQWDNGWPLAFYVPGAIAVIWFVFWTLLVFDGPDVHPRISLEEKHYIENTTGRTQEGTQKQSTPWLAIFTSMPFWAVLWAQVANTWGVYLMMNELPTYMDTVLFFDLKSNSLLNALPYLVKWIISVGSSVVADHLLRRNMFNIGQIRKIFTSVGFLIPGLALIGMKWTGCDKVAAITLFTVCIGINGIAYSGYACNHLDIAPNHAGILMAIINSAGNISGFLAPYVVGVIVTTQGSLSQWQSIFFGTAGVYVVFTLFYVVFASGQEQSWNRPKTSQDKEASSSDRF